MSGWISLHRRIQDHWLWEDKPFDKRSAWIDVLLMANHKDNKFLLGNELIEVERGSFITSEVKLSERWGWSRTKVRSFLELLEKDNMLVKKSDNKKTALTIVNYNDYQVRETSKEQQKNNNKTSKEQQKNTNNNDNNDNNDNKKDIANLKKPQKHKYGDYQNVLLSDIELEKLKNEFPNDWKARIEKVSEYCASTGKTYKNYLATIRNWAKKDKSKESEGKYGNRIQFNVPKFERKDIGEEGADEYPDDLI